MQFTKNKGLNGCSQNQAFIKLNTTLNHIPLRSKIKRVIVYSALMGYISKSKATWLIVLGELKHD